MGSIYSLFRDGLKGNTAHYINLKLASLASPYSPSENLETVVCGIHFRSPIGAAAGLDRNADFIDQLYRSGFGYIELGSITSSTERRANKNTEVIDYKNKICVQDAIEESRGLMWVLRNLKANNKGPRGVNIKPNNETLKSIPYVCDDEFVYNLVELYPFVDYLTLNLASNKVNKMQYYRKEERYRSLFSKVVRARDFQIGLQVANECGLEVEIPYKARRLIPPLFVKIDYDGFETQKFVKICQEEGIDGIILTGTNEMGQGGDLLNDIAYQKLQEFYRHTKGDLALISVGGINSGQEVLRRLKAGANLVQVYSAVNLEGTAVVKKITQEFDEALQKENIKNVKELIKFNFI